MIKYYQETQMTVVHYFECIFITALK